LFDAAENPFVGDNNFERGFYAEKNKEIPIRIFINWLTILA